MGARCTLLVLFVLGCGTETPAPPPMGMPGDAGCAALHTRGIPVDWSHDRIAPGPRALLMRAALAETCGTMPDASVPDAGTDDGGVGPNLDWNFTTTAPVNATPALWIANFPNPSASDAVFFGTKAAGRNFFKLTNLYAASPTVAWSQITGGLDGSAVALSLNGTKVYALDQTGDLYCFDTSNGGQCAGWSQPFFHTGSAVSLSSPWVDYATGAIYYGDLGGHLNKVDGNTGSLVWRASTFPIRSSVIAFGGFLYFGDDGGTFRRAQDPGTSPPATTDAAFICNSGPACGFVNGATLDVTLGKLWAAENGSIYEFPATGAWSFTQASLNTPAGQLMFSSPTIDLGAGNLYIGYLNTIFRVPYPLGSRPMGTIMYGAGASGAFPKSSPLAWNGKVYIGNGAGQIEQYGCLGGTRSPDLIAIAGQYGNTIDTAPVIDFANGNILFGYSNGAAGGLVQITQAGNWGCGTQSACSTAGCGGGACTQPMACVPDGTPPSVYWLSEGGETGSAGGFLLDQSVSGVIAPGTSSVNGFTVTFGSFSDETY